MGVFLADTPTMLGRLRAAARAGDTAEVAAAAHAIKGAAGLFSQGPAFECARRLEKVARTGDLSSIEAVCADLETAMVGADPTSLRGLPFKQPRYRMRKPRAIAGRASNLRATRY